MKLSQIGQAVTATECERANGKGSRKGSTTYNFVAPKVQLQRDHEQINAANSNNTITENYSNAATALNADGSPVLTEALRAMPAFMVGATYSMRTRMPQSTNTFAYANGTRFVINSSDWRDVAKLEFPLFSGRLLILVS
jgi:hypothetical protein